MNRPSYPAWLFWSGVVGAVTLFCWLCFDAYLPCIPLVTLSRARVYLIPRPWLAKAMGVAGLCIPVAAGTAYAMLRRSRPMSRPRRVCFPLLFLPCAFIGFLFPGLPLALATNVMFFLPLALLAWTVLRVMLLYEHTLHALPAHRLAWLLLGGLTLFYGLAGYRIALRFGDYYVDEGHYLVQMESLRRDGDLDLRNNMGFDVDEAIRLELAERQIPPDRAAQVSAEIEARIKARLHVSDRTRGRQWYSWHPWGLPVLLWPFYAMGTLALHLALGFCSAAGCTVAFLLCLRCSASKAWSAALVLLLASSVYWLVYSVRCLPEVLGATLFISAVYATYLFPSHPARAVALLLFCCACLPCVHIRFAACSVLAGLYFIFHMVFIYRARRTSVVMGGGLLLCALLGGLYLLFDRDVLLRISRYSTGNVFFVYPEGVWLSLFSERGLFYSFPLSVFLLAAPLIAVFTDRGNRLLHSLAIATAAVTLVLFGSADCWDGGPTLSGRYLLVFVPLLLPAAAHVAARGSTWGKGWILLLGLYSASYTVVALAALARLPRDFLHLPLSTFKYTLPLLRDLFAPYRISDIMVGHPYHGMAAFTTNLFPVLLMLVSLILLLTRRLKQGWFAALLALFVLLAADMHIANNADHAWQPDWIEQVWSDLPIEKTRVLFLGGRSDDALARHSNRFAGFRPVRLTLADLGQLEKDGAVSQPRIEPNGWEHKGYRWFTLVAPFAAGAGGPRLVELSGSVRGACRPHIALRQGASTRMTAQATVRADGTFDYRTVIDYAQEGGHVYILLRLEGSEGSVEIDRLRWTPVDSRGSST